MPPEDKRNFPIFADEYQAAVKEIKANKGKVLKIAGRDIYYKDASGNMCMFMPEYLRNQSGTGIFWHKKEVPKKDNNLQ